MIIIRNFIYLSISIIFLAISNVNAKNIEDFGWSFFMTFLKSTLLLRMFSLINVNLTLMNLR